MILKRMWIPFLITFFVTLGFRIYQVVFLTDTTSTEFLKRNYGYTIYIFIALLLIELIVTAVLSLPIPNFPSEPKKGSKPLQGIFLLLSALGLGAYEIISSLSKSEDNGFFSTIVIILGCLSAVVLVLQSICLLIDRNIFRNFSAIFVIVPIWLAVDIVYLTFVHYKNVVNISEDLLHVIALLSLLIFFFTYSKTVAGVQSEKTLKRSLYLGLFAFTASICYSVPTVIMTIIDGDAFSIGKILRLVTVLLFAFFVLCYCIELTYHYKIYSHNVRHMEIADSGNDSLAENAKTNSVADGGEVPDFMQNDEIPDEKKNFFDSQDVSEQMLMLGETDLADETGLVTDMQDDTYDDAEDNIAKKTDNPVNEELYSENTEQSYFEDVSPAFHSDTDLSANTTLDELLGKLYAESDMRDKSDKASKYYYDDVGAFTSVQQESGILDDGGENNHEMPYDEELTQQVQGEEIFAQSGKEGQAYMKDMSDTKLEKVKVIGKNPEKTKKQTIADPALEPHTERGSGNIQTQTQAELTPKQQAWKIFEELQARKKSRQKREQNEKKISSGNTHKDISSDMTAADLTAGDEMLHGSNYLSKATPKRETIKGVKIKENSSSVRNDNDKKTFNKLKPKVKVKAKKDISKVISKVKVKQKQPENTGAEFSGEKELTDDDFEKFLKEYDIKIPDNSSPNSKNIDAEGVNPAGDRGLTTDIDNLIASLNLNGKTDENFSGNTNIYSVNDAGNTVAYNSDFSPKSSGTYSQNMINNEGLTDEQINDLIDNILND